MPGRIFSVSRIERTSSRRRIEHQVHSATDRSLRRLGASRLASQNRALLDLRWRGEEFLGPCKECASDFPLEMSVSTRGVGERVKNCESRGPESDSEPIDSAGL